jgi:twinkle protein
VASKGNFEFRKSELTIWSGFKGHGKSLVISQVLENFISTGEKVFIISPEFPAIRVLHRMMMQSLGVRNMNLQNVVEWLMAIEDNLWLYDQQSSLKPIEVIAACRYAHETFGVNHILIDSLMKCGIGTEDYTGQKKFVDSLQQVAHKNGIHIHLVAHARKQQDDGKIGGLHDVKGASEIADMAENVIFIWRNKQKEQSKDVSKQAEPDCIVKIEAQRNGDGWIGTIPLYFDKSNFTFKESEWDSQNSRK